MFKQGKVGQAGQLGRLRVMQGRQEVVVLSLSAVHYSVLLLIIVVSTLSSLRHQPCLRVVVVVGRQEQLPVVQQE